MVLVKNPAKLRPYWYLSRMLELLEGDDDRVRSVRVRKSDGGIHNHSPKHLYPLGLSLIHFHQAGNPLDGTAEAAVVATDRPLDQVESVGCGSRPDIRPRRHVGKRTDNESEFLWC